MYDEIEMTLEDILMDPFSFVEGNGLYVSGNHVSSDEFETYYIKVRDREKRILSVDAIRELPVVPASHLHFKEWQVRKFSADKLVTHLRAKNHAVVLELGCGNGWLSNVLARNLEAMVVGVDMQQTELKQAVQAFGQQQNLHFLYGNILENIFKEKSIDAIVLAASVQYFKDFDKLVLKLVSLLKDTGEIHIVDSPFYDSHNDAMLARQRSEQHFALMGTPEMNGKYFHHSLQQLMPYHYKIMHNPKSFISRFKRKVLRNDTRVFPWICIWK